MVYTEEKIKYLIKLRHHIKYSIKKLLKNKKSKRDIFFDNLKLKMKNREIFRGISYFDTPKESNCRLLKTKKFEVLRPTEKEVVCLFYHPKEQLFTVTFNEKEGIINSIEGVSYFPKNRHHKAKLRNLKYIKEYFKYQCDWMEFRIGVLRNINERLKTRNFSPPT